MDSEHIHALLEKYWRCETSLEEEQQLRTYFRRPDIPESLRETAALFRHLDESRNKVLDSTFDKEVMKRVSKTRTIVRKWVYNSMRIAAGIVVVVMAVWLVRVEIRQSQPVSDQDTYSDPELAFEETKKALLMISKSFNLAEQQARKIQLFNEAQNEIRQEKSAQQEPEGHL